MLHLLKAIGQSEERSVSIQNAQKRRIVVISIAAFSCSKSLTADFVNLEVRYAEIDLAVRSLKALHRWSLLKLVRMKTR